MPDTPELQAHFCQPGVQAPGCGFPVAKILALFHMGTGLLLEVMAAHLRSHEMSRVEVVHKAGDELVLLKVNPNRSGRVEWRVRTRRPKEFPVMKKPRSEWRKQLMGNTFAD